MLDEIAAELRTRPEQVVQAVRRLAEERRRLEKDLAAAAAGGGAGTGVEELAGAATDLDGAKVLAAAVEVPDAKALLELADRLKGKLGSAAIVLGTAADGRVHLVASVAPELVARGVKAGAVVKAAAEVAGGGGGGRDTMAQAGGKDPAKLPEALAAARAEIERALAGSRA
jgi:alanyl-tRNA synthetase